MSRLFSVAMGALLRRRLMSALPLRACAVGSRGFLLPDVLIALMLLTLVGAATLGGLSVASRGGGLAEGQSVAENIARNQMEQLFTLPYQAPPSTYPAIATPAGYSVTAQAVELLPGVQDIAKLVVTVDRDGAQVLVLETLRVRP